MSSHINIEGSAILRYTILAHQDTKSRKRKADSTDKVLKARRMREGMIKLLRIHIRLIIKNLNGKF